jgi:hypothetical protein
MAQQATKLFPNTWGIFDQNGVAVLIVDTTVSMHYSNETRVSQFPVEKGGFVSYNKVATPFKAKVRLAVGGDRQRISDALSKMESLLDDTADLYHIVTPEITYLNTTFEKFNYARSSNKGQDLALIDAELLEVREVVPAYTNVQLPPSKTKKVNMSTMSSHGKQQTQPPPAPNYGEMSFADLKALALKNSTH